MSSQRRSELLSKVLNAGKNLEGMLDDALSLSALDADGLQPGAAAGPPRPGGARRARPARRPAAPSRPHRRRATPWRWSTRATCSRSSPTWSPTPPSTAPRRTASSSRRARRAGLGLGGGQRRRCARGVRGADVRALRACRHPPGQLAEGHRAGAVHRPAAGRRQRRRAALPATVQKRRLGLHPRPRRPPSATRPRSTGPRCRWRRTPDGGRHVQVRTPSSGVAPSMVRKAKPNSPGRSDSSSTPKSSSSIARLPLIGVFAA